MLALKPLALWLAQELIKFAAGAAVRKGMGALMTQLDLDLPNAIATRDESAVARAFKVASGLAVKRPLTPAEQLAVSLLWRPELGARKPWR